MTFSAGPNEATSSVPLSLCKLYKTEQKSTSLPLRPLKVKGGLNFTECLKMIQLIKTRTRMDSMDHKKNPINLFNVTPDVFEP